MNKYKPCSKCASEDVKPLVYSKAVRCQKCGHEESVDDWQKRPIEDALRKELDVAQTMSIVMSSPRPDEKILKELRDRMDYLFRNVDDTYDIPTIKEIPMLTEILKLLMNLLYPNGWKSLLEREL